MGSRCVMLSGEVTEVEVTLLMYYSFPVQCLKRGVIFTEFFFTFFHCHSLLTYIFILSFFLYFFFFVRYEGALFNGWVYTRVCLSFVGINHCGGREYDMTFRNNFDIPDVHFFVNNQYKYKWHAWDTILRSGSSDSYKIHQDFFLLSSQ